MRPAHGLGGRIRPSSDTVRKPSHGAEVAYAFAAESKSRITGAGVSGGRGRVTETRGRLGGAPLPKIPPPWLVNADPLPTSPDD